LYVFLAQYCILRKYAQATWNRQTEGDYDQSGGPQQAALASAILTSPLARTAAKGINQGNQPTNQQGNQNAPAQKVNDWFGGEPDSGLF
jgi:hypothetical protein